MTNTVMFDLQAAVMAAACSTGGNGGLTGIPEDGSSFSEVLAAQAAGGTAAEGTAVNTEAVDGEVLAEETNPVIAEILSIIENADEGVKKALQKLLETMLNAFKGSEDGGEKKTDLFAIFSDSSAGLLEDEEDYLLIGAEILNQIGIAVESDVNAEKDADKILSDIEKLVNKIFGEEDTDENTAAEVLAAMLNVPAEEIAFAEDEVKCEAVENAAEVLTAPKQAIAENEPERLPEMEQLFSDVKAAVVSVKQHKEIPDAFRMNFNAVKINNAAEQIKAISGEEVNPEIAALNMRPEAVIPQNEISEAPVLDAPMADSVELQIREVVTERLMNIEGDNGSEELTMILKPENLGEVAVKLIKEEGAVTVLLSAQYDEVGKLMTDRAAALGESLQNQNYTVKEILVVAPNNAAEQMGLDFTNQGFGFMHNSNGSGQGENNGGYHGIDGIDEIEATETDTGTVRLKEAKLWTTA